MLEIELNKKQIEHVFREAIEDELIDAKKYIKDLIECFYLQRDEEDYDFYQLNNYDYIMSIMEKVDKNILDSCATSTVLFWCSLPKSDKGHFEMEANDEEFKEGIELFDKAIQDIEKRKKDFIKHSINSKD